MLATGRYLKTVARTVGFALVTTAFSRAAYAPLGAASGTAQDAQQRPERQPLGVAWEGVPHCRVLLSRQHAIDGSAQPRKVAVLASTLCQDEAAQGASVQVVIGHAGVVARCCVAVDCIMVRCRLVSVRSKSQCVIEDDSVD